jgi:hypothetical protein
MLLDVPAIELAVPPELDIPAEPELDIVGGVVPSLHPEKQRSESAAPADKRRNMGSRLRASDRGLLQTVGIFLQILRRSELPRKPPSKLPLTASRLLQAGPQ